MVDPIRDMRRIKPWQEVRLRPTAPRHIGGFLGCLFVQMDVGEGIRNPFRYLIERQCCVIRGFSALAVSNRSQGNRIVLQHCRRLPTWCAVWRGWLRKALLSSTGTIRVREYSVLQLQMLG